MDMMRFLAKNRREKTMPDIEQIFDKKYFEYVDCNLCGADESLADTIYDPDVKNIPDNVDKFREKYSSSSKDVFYERLLRCKKCGLIYASPRPKLELVLGGYHDAIDKEYISQESGRKITFIESLKTIRKLLPAGKLLDIGAASGIFVKVARDAGYDAYGIEPSYWMCEMAKKLYGVTVFPGIVESGKFDNEEFDIITMWDVLEHVPDPLSTLKEIRRILKPGGYLVINYPRIDDWLAKLFGRKWWFLLSVHLFYFTPETLLKYMKHFGFQKVLHKPHIQRLSYGYLVERLKVYSRFLGVVAGIPCLLPGIKDMLIPYFSSQYLMISRKKR